MAFSILIRLAVGTAALLFAASTSALSSEDSTCEATGAIRIQEARLQIVPNYTSHSVRAVLSGRAMIADPDLVPVDAGRALCRATLGGDFHLSKRELCDAFSLLSGNDTLKPDGNALEFSLSASLVQQDPQIAITQPKGKGICASRLIVEVQPGPRGHLSYVSRLPTSLAKDRAEFELGQGARARRT